MFKGGRAGHPPVCGLLAQHEWFAYRSFVEAVKLGTRYLVAGKVIGFNPILGTLYRSGKS